MIESANLELRPFAPAHWLALVESTSQFEAQFGFPVADGLRDFLGEVSPAWLDALRNAQAADPWVHGFGVVHRADRLVIGSAGFKGPPDSEQIVEIGYGIAPAYQGRGYATEATMALIRFAHESNRVRNVRAHAKPESNASVRVLKKCGFENVGLVMDPEDGVVWRWELALTLAHPALTFQP